VTTIPTLPEGSSGSTETAEESDDRRTSDGSGSEKRNTDAAAIGAAVAEFQGLNPPPRLPLSRADISSRGSVTSLTRMGSPRTVRELGSDYTRYYNPFATRNNSSTDVTTPLPRYNSSFAKSVPRLEKRYSNPFTDEKAEKAGKAGEKSAGVVVGTTAVSDAGGATPAPSMTKTSRGAPMPATSNNAFVDSADPEKAFFPYLDDRLGAPGAETQYSFPLYWDDKEADDDLHMPMADDDQKLKPRWRDHFGRDNILSTVGMIFMLVGLLCTFIILPVLSSTGLNILHYTYDTPLDQMPGYDGGKQWTWASVNNRTYSPMKNVRAGLIDPDTPSSAMTRTAVDGSPMKLVYSDEFNQPNRTFYPGDDPFWHGFNGWYGATQDLEWYDPDAITTWDGALEIRMDAFQNHGLNYRSGMLQSWNQNCFKGGVFEVSVSLPGPAGVHGLWPGCWTMGNLGRPGYLATTEGLWPYTYNECDVGITPNQSSPDGLNGLPGQRLTSCGCPGSDHPSPGTGRGAPEIDIIEASGDYGGQGLGVATQSFQVAPFDVWWYPNYDFFETPDYSMSFVNTYTGGPFQQAVSTTTMLNNNWYDGKEYQRYSFEYQPGGDSASHITWRIGDTVSAAFDARAVGPNGNIGQRLISEEPMSMILNLGISNNWVDINWAKLVFPTVMRVDYVRWYQKEGEEMVTCDPPGYETTQYIADHPEAYQNPNYTVSRTFSGEFLN